MTIAVVLTAGLAALLVVGSTTVRAADARADDDIGASSSSTSWQITAATYPPYGPLFYGYSPQGVAHDPVRGTLLFNGRNFLREVRPSPQPNDNSSSSKTFALPWYNFTTVATMDPMLPPSLVAQGYFHVGDTDYMDTAEGGGYLIAPVEEPSYSRPIFAVLKRASSSSSNTLTAPFVLERYVNATGQRHCPWAAFAPFSEQGFFDFVLSSEYDNVTEVFAAKWPSLDHYGRYRLETVGATGVMHVQGGVVHNFNLYLSTDQGVNPTGDLFVFDLTVVMHAEGPTAPLIASYTRALQNGTVEMEGMTIDAQERMWLVTSHFATIDDFIYTLEEEKSRSGNEKARGDPQHRHHRV